MLLAFLHRLLYIFRCLDSISTQFIAKNPKKLQYETIVPGMQKAQNVDGQLVFL